MLLLSIKHPSIYKTQNPIKNKKFKIKYIYTSAIKKEWGQMDCTPDVMSETNVGKGDDVIAVAKKVAKLVLPATGNGNVTSYAIHLFNNESEFRKNAYLKGHEMAEYEIFEFWDLI